MNLYQIGLGEIDITSLPPCLLVVTNYFIYSLFSSGYHNCIIPARLTHKNFS